MLKRREFFKFLFYFLFFNLNARYLHARQKTNSTKVLSSLIFNKFLLNINHPERPERIKYIIDFLNHSKLSGLLEYFEKQRDVDIWIKEIHTKKHIDSLKLNFTLAEIVSRHAVVICLEGVDRIIKKNNTNVFCAVRPPGHHALNTGKDEGFCFYNYIAISARYIQKRYNISRILIIDWDYHHGNSTEHFFYDDPSVLFFSTHDQFAYPGTGSPNRKGKGKGKGYNINIHLPCNTKDKDIIDVFENVLVPRANLFKPEFVLISSGFDSRINDPLGCFNISDDGFRKLTKIAKKIAKENCNHRLMSILEGGYNLDGNAKSTIAHVNELNNFN